MTLTARAAPLRPGRALRPRSVLGLGAALLLGAGLCLGGCARPGQLGQPVPVPAPAPVPAAAAPAPEPSPAVEPVRGTLDSRVTIRTPGPAVYSVRTVVLSPGESLGWQRHPGTAMAVVRTGAVTLVREGACAAVRHAAGEALFIADAVPHRLTNHGDRPAELLVTLLVSAGAAETVDVGPACPAPRSSD